MSHPFSFLWRTSFDNSYKAYLQATCFLKLKFFLKIKTVFLFFFQFLLLYISFSKPNYPCTFLVLEGYTELTQLLRVRLMHQSIEHCPHLWLLWCDVESSRECPQCSALFVVARLWLQVTVSRTWNQERRCLREAGKRISRLLELCA